MTTLSLLRPATALFSLVFFLTAGAPRPAHDVKTAPCKTCVLNGPTCVAPGQAGIFTLTGGTTVGWTTGCGTIVHFNSTTVTIQFPSSGCSSTNVETAGASCGGADLWVTISSSCAMSGQKPAPPPAKTH